MLEKIAETNERVAVNVRQASKISTLSEPFIRGEIKNGNLPVKRPGGSRRVIIMMSDFLEYLKGENKNAK